MKWIELRIRTTSEASDAISEMLMSVGAGGVAIEDPDDIRREIERPGSLDYTDDEFLNALGEDVVIKSYFPGSVNLLELIELIKEKILFISSFLNTGHGFEGTSEVDDEDWSTAWKKYYKPFNISNRVVIKPTWELYNKKENEIIIEMDPGMAFGTGTHETTKMCAELLESYVKSYDTVLDVGCGTGILSIIAAKLGASNIEAIDIDEVAVKVTGENCKLNNVDDIIDFKKGILRDVDKTRKFDIIVANIIADVIIDISEHIKYYLKAEGTYITSGIIKERRDQVIEVYEKAGFEVVGKLEMGEWVAIVFKCRNSL